MVRLVKPPEKRRLFTHRAQGLLDLGFTVEQTLLLVERTDIVHEAQALLERGWPHEFVVDELANERSTS